MAATSLSGRARYFEYYFASRAWEMNDTRAQWLESQSEADGRSYRCTICDGKYILLETHPDLIRRHGLDVRVCRTCDDLLRRYGGFGPGVSERVSPLMHALADARDCDVCGESFDLQGEQLAFQNTASTDIVYPNLFANVCPACFARGFRDYRRGNSRTHLDRLYDLFVLTGRVPTQDLGSLLYACRQRETVLQALELLTKARTPEGYAEEFGSFFAALVASGILPNGSMKMAIGTMVLADDGHLCLSIPEKEIDDYLSRHGVGHDKEVPYPGCGLRCDWEVFTEPDHRVFIEYFGLMGNPDYAKRSKEKAALAEAAAIELVALYPEADWKTILGERFG